MKRAVTYKVDIAIDEHGSIVACLCECDVGMGPNAHCMSSLDPSQFFSQWQNNYRGNMYIFVHRGYRLSTIVNLIKAHPLRPTNFLWQLRREQTFSLTHVQQNIETVPVYNDYFCNICFKVSNISTVSTCKYVSSSLRSWLPPRAPSSKVVKRCQHFTHIWRWNKIYSNMTSFFRYIKNERFINWV